MGPFLCPLMNKSTLELATQAVATINLKGSFVILTKAKSFIISLFPRHWISPVKYFVGNFRSSFALRVILTVGKLSIIAYTSLSLGSHVKYLLKKLPCLLRRSMIRLSMRCEVSV